MFTFDKFRGSLDTSIFEVSSSATNNARSRLPSRNSFNFLWLCKKAAFMNAFILSQFLYSQLIWMFHGKRLKP